MKRNIIIITVIVVILISSIIMISFSLKQDDFSEIPKDYIAVFKGEDANVVKTTYVYEIKKKNKKTKYKYINTVGKFEGYDNTTWNEKVTKKGTVKTKKEIFKKAKKHGANSYVKYMKNDKVYQIEDLKKVLDQE